MKKLWIIGCTLMVFAACKPTNSDNSDKAVNTINMANDTGLVTSPQNGEMSSSGVDNNTTVNGKDTDMYKKK